MMLPVTHQLQAHETVAVLKQQGDAPFVEPRDGQSHAWVTFME